MPPNELYPDPPARVRMRLPTGPHDLMFTWRMPGTTCGVGCVCTSDQLRVPMVASLDYVWDRWQHELQHDPTAGPVRRPQPNAQRALAL